MSSFPVRFGKYELIDLLATGGMAEVFRARLAGKQDPTASKIMAVKRILPAYSNNQEFIRLFEKEIGLAMNLAHPNLVRIYDYGAVKGQHYMAMEYVHGKSLSAVVDHCVANQMRLPVDFVCFVIREVAKALAYAHGLKDSLTGKYVGIIHRDISPQNFMLSYTGQVKLFDFGVAKAVAKDSSTAGTVKGKPAYLSPEQATGEELDGRTDLFSLGIVFWELLTGRRLFFHEQPLVTLKNVMHLEIPPPSTFNKAIVPNIDAVVMKCLERDLNTRYQLAQHICADLDKIMATIAPNYDEEKAAAFLRQAYGSQIDMENEQLVAKMVTVAPPPVENVSLVTGTEISLDDIDDSGLGAPAATAQPEWKRNHVEATMEKLAIAKKERTKEIIKERTRDIVVPPHLIKPNIPMHPPSRGYSGFFLTLLLLGAAGGGWWWWQNQKQLAQPSAAPVTAQAAPAQPSAPVQPAAVQPAAAPAVPERAPANVGAASPAAPTLGIPTEDPKPGQCGPESKPVCGLSKATFVSFDNSCAAQAANAPVIYEGKCDQEHNPWMDFKEVGIKDGWRTTTAGDRAVTYGDGVEVSISSSNMPSVIRVQLVLIAVNGMKEVRVKEMATFSTIVSMTDDLPTGIYGLELRALDQSGGVVIKKKYPELFHLGKPSEIKARFMEL